MLLQVLAAGVTNTEINTRLGWYSSTVTTGTETPTAAENEKAKQKADGGWNKATPFPFILENIWMGSNFDGAFAQFVKVSAGEVFPVDCDWSDAELVTIPCAYGTAEGVNSKKTRRQSVRY